MDQKPSVGRIVHYRTDEKSPCIAGIITEVNSDGSVCLQLFVPMQTKITVARVEQEGKGVWGSIVGSWHFPERV